MRLETLINESDKRLFHKMGNQAHCVHSVLPPLTCSASFVIRCLYNFV